MEFFININHHVSACLNWFVLSHWLENFVWIFADLPIFFLPIFLFSTWIFYTFFQKSISHKKLLLFIFYSVVLGISINLVIQQFVHLERPDTFVNAILNHVPDNSFPSDHAVVSVSFLFWLWFFNFRKVFWCFLPFAILMNFCRIAGWLHWFFDVFVAFVIWTISAFFIYKTQNAIFFQKLNSFLLKIAKIFKL